MVITHGNKAVWRRHMAGACDNQVACKDQSIRVLPVPSALQSPDLQQRQWERAFVKASTSRAPRVTW